MMPIRSLQVAKRAGAVAAAMLPAAHSLAAFEQLAISVTAAQDGRLVVVDLHAILDDPINEVIVITGAIVNTSADAVVHSPCCPGWAPCWDVAACGPDSFVTIGGSLAGDATKADPTWGPLGFANPALPAGVGWYETNPANEQGTPAPVVLTVYDAPIAAGLGVQLARLALAVDSLPQQVSFSGNVAFLQPPPCPCDPVPVAQTWTIAAQGDLVPDGVIDGADLGTLLAAWGSTGTAADLDGSGAVDGADIGLLLALFDIA